MTTNTFYAHPTAHVSPDASIGDGTKIWRLAHVREHAIIGNSCNIGTGVYVESYVRIGSRVKIQNYVSVYEGVTLEDGVFVGPHACFTNDLFPRAITPDGELKTADDWEITPTVVKYGASIGGQSVIRCGVTIGEFALIGAGSVVTHDVPPYALVFGNPARHRGYVCKCARRVAIRSEVPGELIAWCEACGQELRIPRPG